MQAPMPTLDRATDASPSRDVLLDYVGRQLAAASSSPRLRGWCTAAASTGRPCPIS